jgi:hypothetical protein
VIIGTQSMRMNNLFFYIVVIGPPALMGWGAPAPSWCGHNSLVTSAWGGWVQ